MQRRKAAEDAKWDEAERQLRAEAEARAQAEAEAERERLLRYLALEQARVEQENERKAFIRRQKAEAELQDPLIQQALALYYRLGGIHELEKCVGVPGFPHCSTWVNRFVQDHRCWRHTTSNRETAMRVALEFEEGLATIGVPQTWRPGGALLQLNREQQVVPFEA